MLYIGTRSNCHLRLLSNLIRQSSRRCRSCRHYPSKSSTSGEDFGGGEASAAVTMSKKHKGNHDKPKPWDEDPNIDHWKIEKFDPSWNESGMLEVSSFSTLFPQYRGKMLSFYFDSARLSSVLLLP